MQSKQMPELAQRFDTLDGKTIGFFWNTKPNGDVFFDTIAELMEQQFKNVKVLKLYPGKPNPAAHSPRSNILSAVEKCDGIVNGFGD